MDEIRRRLDTVFREEHGRVVGALVRRFKDLDLAEDAAADAFEIALQRWPAEGVPPNPGGWLTTTATRRVLDRLRRESARDAKETEAMAAGTPEQLPLGVVDDDRLRLLFLCCHPALAFENRVALTLRLVSGLTTDEIARAFLAEDRTIAQRLTRAKRKIREANIAFRIPERDDLPERLSGVLAVLYLVFNEGYLGSAVATRDDLAVEAIRLTRQLCAQLSAEPEAQGLLALLLLTRARRAARVVDGRLVPLDHQDRTRWDRALIDEGHRIVRSLLALGRPGPYQVQAAIAAVHTDAPAADEVDWAQVVDLYDLLLRLTPSPVVALNRALAVAHTEGPAAALALVEALRLSDYHPWHAARGHLLEQLGDPAEARDAFSAAIQRATIRWSAPIWRRGGPPSAEKRAGRSHPATTRVHDATDGPD